MMKTFLFTSFALLAFAANSILCRIALGNNSIDAASFTSIRLAAGIFVLFLILGITKKVRRKSISKGSWLSSCMLFLYAAAFSFAYISLDTGTGALILFGAVQITIIMHSVLRGRKLASLEVLGALVSFIGFIYLMLPGITAPPLIGFSLMTLSGFAWGIYTVNGYHSESPLVDTAYNFLKTVPLLLLLFLFTYSGAHYSMKGILLALISGGVTSGIGYAIWYMAIKGLSSTQTAVVQLLVPVLAAFGGVLFMSELITLRLTISSAMILGGVCIVTLSKKN